jgi:hypothetical protein
MRPLTDRQLLHRQYLQSELWKQKRLEALEHYGQKCNRCGQFGTDVHHKTYKRVGSERLSDLEVLCRECHEAHHSAERATRSKRSRKKGIHVKALFGYLTEDQKKILQEKCQDDLYTVIMANTKKGDKIRNEATNMLGMDYWYGLKSRKKTSDRSPFKSSSPKHFRPSVRY